MNFNEAVNYISESEKYGIVPGLESIKRLCSALSNPQNKLRFIHIAGTNGKGSVGAFINSVLSEAGYKTGRYVSPAVMDYLEKIQYNNKNISEEEFASAIEKVKKAADSVVSDGFPHPTVFEMETAAAFCFFAEKKCDIVLLEAGMGGKSDATNVIDTSELSLITSVSLEHTQFLGSTLEEISGEKAGIIKRNGRVITVSQDSGVMNVIRKVSEEKNAKLSEANLSDITGYKFENGIQSFSYGSYRDIRISLTGKFQTENAALAIEACTALREKGFSISDKDIYKGLETAVWPGRFEIIKKQSPVIIIDGSHNSSAAEKLRESLDLYFPDKRTAFIMGTFKDKNFTDMARLTADKAEKIYTVSTEGKRALSSEELARSVSKFNKNVTAASSVEEAVSLCCSGNFDVVVAFGSLSFLSKLKKCVNGEQ
ncbi:MAG: folylpolyglutamate synthase/dihydrofolate synthase family protein [Oscillospiraceae bacterium]|nr:folylpolyglutamate synthase/dihydrofolate synthase family protein [Oscillospiraceae bacterium]